MNQQTITQRLLNPQYMRQYVNLIKNQQIEVVQSFYESLKNDGIKTSRGQELEILIKERLGE